MPQANSMPSSKKRPPPPSAPAAGVGARKRLAPETEVVAGQLVWAKMKTHAVAAPPNYSFFGFPAKMAPDDDEKFKAEAKKRLVVCSGDNTHNCMEPENLQDFRENLDQRRKQNEGKNASCRQTWDKVLAALPTPPWGPPPALAAKDGGGDAADEAVPMDRASGESAGINVGNAKDVSSRKRKNSGQECPSSPARTEAEDEQARLDNTWVEIVSALQGHTADTCSKRFGRLMPKSAETQAAAGWEDVSQRSASEPTVASSPVASKQPGVVVLGSALDDAPAFFFAVGELTTCVKCPQQLMAPVRCNVLICPKCKAPNTKASRVRPGGGAAGGKRPGPAQSAAEEPEIKQEPWILELRSTNSQPNKQPPASQAASASADIDPALLGVADLELSIKEEESFMQSPPSRSTEAVHVSSECWSKSSESEAEHRSNSSPEGFSSGMGSDAGPQRTSAPAIARQSAKSRKLTWEECEYDLSRSRFFIGIQIFARGLNAAALADMVLMVDDTDKLKPRPLTIQDLALEYIFRESGSTTHKLRRRKAGSDRWVNSGGVAGATFEPGLQRLRCRYGHVSFGGGGSSQIKMRFVRPPSEKSTPCLPAASPIQSFWLPRCVG